MSIPIQQAKADLRRRVRSMMAAVSPEDRRNQSARACVVLRAQPAWQKARAVLAYFPLADELDLTPLLSEAFGRKMIALPRYDPVAERYVACVVNELAEDLVMGKFGVREPSGTCETVPVKQLDFALVPGVAFDCLGHRLGRGKGFYDRLLVNIGGIKCGIGLDEQVERVIPAEPHDVMLNCILTPTRWLLCDERSALK